MSSQASVVGKNLGIYKCTTRPARLKEYIKQYKSKEEDYINMYKLAKWQRKNRWPLDFKMNLIISILEGADISKITVGIDYDEKSVIIDGGHRTRTMTEFMDNEWSIKRLSCMWLPGWVVSILW